MRAALRFCVLPLKRAVAPLLKVKCLLRITVRGTKAAAFFSWTLATEALGGLRMEVEPKFCLGCRVWYFAMLAYILLKTDLTFAVTVVSAAFGLVKTFELEN